MSYGNQGGFLAGSSQGGGGQNDSPGGSKRSGVQSLRPVTIHQLLSATQAHPDAEFVIDGVETKDVSFVACVRNLTKTTTNVSYLVEDGTGQIDARQWSEQGADDDGPSNGIEINTYVRILGSIKVFANKRHINATNVHLITDFNEVLFHQAEVVHTSLAATRGPVPGAAPGAGAYQQGAPGSGAAGGENPYSDTKSHTNQAGGIANSYSDLPIAQRKLMQHIALLQSKDALPEEGINIHALHREAGGQLPIERVVAEVNSLVEEGLLYATIDDDHVLPTA